MTDWNGPCCIDMATIFGDDVPSLLDTRFSLPLERPFTSSQAVSWGVSRYALRKLHACGLVRRLLKGVYVAAQVEDSLTLRAQALGLVVPPTAVVTDWSACWLHTGLLPPNDHLHVPPVSIFMARGRGRLRNALSTSGERTLSPADVVDVLGLRVTSPLRTAWDLGRLCRRDIAIGALDGLLRHGSFSKDALIAGVDRFRRQRGVVQLRELAPLADARAESPSESVLRLRWLDTSGLPAPTPQVPILDGRGREIFRVDLGVPEIRFGAEYDGERWHTRDENVEYDAARREWLRCEGWTIRVLKKENLFGADQDVSAILLDGVLEARRRLGQFRPPS